MFTFNKTKDHEKYIYSSDSTVFGDKNRPNSQIEIWHKLSQMTIKVHRNGQYCSMGTIEYKL
jgi:hypothetical protein